MVVTNWPMWVVGFTLFIDGMDQYIVRGSSDQIKSAFGVGDTAIGLLFSAFILVNGIITMPAGYLADRWNRTRAMAVTIVLWSVISALGGLVPTAAFGLLVVIRASLGFGQAVTDPSGSSVIADYYGTERRGRAFSIQQCLSYVGLGMGLAIGGAIGPLFHGNGWRVAFFVSLFPGLLVAYLCWRLPEPSRGTADRAHVTHSDEMELADDKGPPLFPQGFRHFLSDMADGLRKDVGTILRIPTMRYALVGVSTVGFVVTAVATWMPNFYQNQLHLTQQAVERHLRLAGHPRRHPGHHHRRAYRRPVGEPVPRGAGRDPRRLHRHQRRAVHGVVHPDTPIRGRVRDPAGRVHGRDGLCPRPAGGPLRCGARQRPRRGVRRLQPGVGRVRGGGGPAGHLGHRGAVRGQLPHRVPRSFCRSPSSEPGA